jgi:NADH-quinone oxidoreductase subunit H
MKDLFIFLIFPGFVFTVLVGMMASWVDRKITARIQWRVGPPWYQSFADVLKLLGKETIVPRGCSHAMFVAAPLIGFAAVILVSSMIGNVNLNPEHGFVGDLIVLIYLLIMPSLALMLGGAASKNPLASLGASREMKLIVAYELPFILAVLVPVIKAGVTINVGQMLDYQHVHGAFLWNWSCILAFVVIILCMQAKLGIVPFDVAEAETEINAGPLIEYSGPLLGIFKLTKMMMLVALPLFLLTIFSGGVNFHGWGIGVSLIKYLLILFVITVIRNTNPRLRIDQALKFFWGPMTFLAVAAVILALLGY